MAERSADEILDSIMQHFKLLTELLIGEVYSAKKETRELYKTVHALSYQVARIEGKLYVKKEE